MPHDPGHPLHVLLGGWRGALESAAPSVVFVSVMVARDRLGTAILAALVTAGVLAVVRLLQRERPVRMLGGLLAVVLAAAVAARTGRPADYFLPGLLGWPMVLVVVAVSWQVVRRTLPPGHPGVLHPRVTHAGHAS
jgi:hypothetical protein